MLKRIPIAVSAAAVGAAMLAAPALAGKSNDTLVWSTDREVNVPLPFFEQVREMVVMARLSHDTLLFRNPKTFAYEPQLATDYKWIDNVTMEFNLRQDVTFHDGTKFSADDVVATVNHLVKPDSGVLTKRNVSWMKSAEKLGEYKVRLNLVKPFPAALEFLSGPLAMLPAEIWSKAKKDATGKPDYGTIPPIGTGPYKTVEHVPGERTVLEINPNYFDGPKGKPSIKKIVFRTVADPEAQIAELLTGSLDWIWDVPKDKAEELKSSGAVQVVNAPTMRISYLSMDKLGRSGADNPWTKQKVRQAVIHAIDRAAIAKNLVGGASSVIHSACYPTQFGCTQDVPQYPYDPAKAKKLLAEAGYPNGFSSDIYAYRQREFTEAVMGYLSKVGIKTNLKYMQYKALRGLVWNGSGSPNHMTWGSYSMNDMSAITSHFFKGGKDDYCRDPDVMKWLETGDTTTDPAVRKDVYKKALSRIQELACWAPLFTYAKNYAYSNDLDFTPTPDEIPRFFQAKWK
ncbi:MAG: ABC transporter substrate-binding protein [Rhodospirillaceae bacterium]|nr:ABC transporter substrate-binding protein [Rhodospirillaceae bacterium]MDD9917797.1 ABC transporter substrate-binding protein [Rhodospirillaceae bacterium]MDD9928085.1 ABC transporter substrate-binding protein [Rhodospirillaceae bacterium]